MEIKIQKNNGSGDHTNIQGNTNDGVHSFLGIPYAEPPIGKLRWKAPVLASLDSYDAIDATKFGHVAIQTIPVFNPNGLGEGITEGEDCLNLNIWTTTAGDDTTSKLKPVVLWIHGGGFFIWSSSLQVTHGDTLAKENDVVVVTINYRLGALGFLKTDAYKEKEGETDPCSNFGLLDWVAALKWVSKYIHYFGGDPNNVNVMGQSAGGSGVSFLLRVPQAEGLFHKIILISRGGDDYANPNVIPPDDSRLVVESRKYINFLVDQELNETTEDAQALLAMVPIEKIKGSLIKYFSVPPTEENGGPLCGFTQAIYGPKVDGKTLLRDYTPWAKSNVKVLMGATEHEGRFFVKPWGTFQFNDPAAIYTKDALKMVTKAFTDVNDEASLNTFYNLNEKENHHSTYFEALDQIITSAVFHEPMYALARDLTSSSIPVYVYYFTRVCPGAEKTKELSYHCIDIPYFFGTLEKRRTLKDLILKDEVEEEGYFNNVDVELSKDIRHGVFSTFAHTGIPSSSAGEWPRVSTTGDLLVACMSNEITFDTFQKSPLFNHLDLLRSSSQQNK